MSVFDWCGLGFFLSFFFVVVSNMYVCMYVCNVVCIFIEGTLQFLLLCFGPEAVAAAAAAAAGVGGGQ